MYTDSLYRGVPARRSIEVYFRDPDLDDGVSIGTAAQALRDPRLTRGERSAIRNLVAAVDRLRERHGYRGFDDATGAVRLVLRARGADGPEVGSGNKLSLPSGNPFEHAPGVRAKRGVVLPRQVATHELTHLLQMQLSGHEIGPRSEEVGMGADVVTPFQAKSVGEGLGDTFAALAAHGWRSGAGYFAQDGGATQVARDFAHPDSPRALMSVDSRYARAVVRDVRTDPHAVGGILVATARALQERVGWDVAEDVFWELMEDESFQTGRQDFAAVARALDAVAQSRAQEQPSVARAIRTAMEQTGLSNAVR